MDKELLDQSQYSTDQLQEIEEGQEKGLDVSYYQNPEFLAIQMREIRLGLESKVDVSIYADKAYDWFQMKEIRKGLESCLDVEKYADPKLSFEVMHQIRKGLMEGMDLTFAKTIPAGLLKELRKAIAAKVDIRVYIKEGYEEEQLRQIRIALERGINIGAHVKIYYRGPSIREIALGLEKGLDVSVYEDEHLNWQQMREIRVGMEEKRKKLLEERKHPEKTENAEIYKDFSLLVSADKMEAFILVAEKGTRIRKDRLLRSLEEKGVKTGIDYAILERLEKQGTDSNMVILATGRRPQTGADGWYEFFFEINMKKEPKLLEDGSVDYQNIKWFELVRKGDVVAKYHEPEPGSPGLNILGDEVPAKKGRELRQLTCKGVTLEPDKKTYIASMDGKIEYKEGGLEVTNILVQDSVTQATGNVEFNGSVYVRGEVGDGAIIRAEKDILVDGFVEGVVLEAGGDIILRKGNNGDGRGRLKANGSIMGRFFERANVKAGKHINGNYCLNSELWADGRIEIAGKNGSLAGGSAYAAQGINAFNIGNAAGIRTDISVGGEEPFLTEMNSLEEKLRSAQRELYLLKNAYADFRRKYAPEVRNSNPIYLKIEDSIYAKDLEIDKLYKKQEELQKERDKVAQVKIVISGSLYPGVLVNINGSKWNSKPIKNVILKKKDGAISVFRNA